MFRSTKNPTVYKLMTRPIRRQMRAALYVICHSATELPHRDDLDTAAIYEPMLSRLDMPKRRLKPVGEAGEVGLRMLRADVVVGAGERRFDVAQAGLDPLERRPARGPLAGTGRHRELLAAGLLDRRPAGQAFADDIAPGSEVSFGQPLQLLLAEALDHAQPQPPRPTLGLWSRPRRRSASCPRHRGRACRPGARRRARRRRPRPGPRASAVRPRARPSPASACA